MYNSKIIALLKRTERLRAQQWDVIKIHIESAILAVLIATFAGYVLHNVDSRVADKMVAFELGRVENE